MSFLLNRNTSRNIGVQHEGFPTFEQDKVTLSFEVFPPKTSSSYESVAHATQEIAALRPDFMSVTYGAGGGTSEHTVNIAADLKKKYDVTVLTHLTCVSSTREHVAAMVKSIRMPVSRIFLRCAVIFRRAVLRILTTTMPLNWYAISSRRAISASAAPATRRVTLRQPIKPRIFCTSRKK